MVKNKKQGSDNFSQIVTVFISLIMLGLPLVITNGFSNITETKSVFYIVCSCLLIFAYLCFALIKFSKNKGRSLKSDVRFIPSDFAVLLYALFTLISAILSQYQSDVWFGGRSRYQGVFVIFLYCAVYYIVSRNYKNSQIFLYCSLIAFSLVSIIGVLNCFGIDVTSFYSLLSQSQKKIYISTIGNVNFYSSYICLLLPLVVAGYCQTKKRLSQIIYILSIIIGSFGMMVTSSESFVIGFVGAMVVLSLFMFRDEDRIKKFLTAVVIIILSAQCYNLIYNAAETKNVAISLLLSILLKPYVSIALIAVFVLMYFIITKKPDKLRLLRGIYKASAAVVFALVIVCFVLANTKDIGVLNKYFRITESWGTYRGEIWSQCIEAFKGFSLKEKLFGIGPEALYNITSTSEIFDGRTIDQAHNEYLQHLLTVGVFGVVSYVSLFVTSTIAVIKKLKDNALAVGLFAGLIAYCVQAVVNIGQPFTTPIMFLYLACIAGMSYNEKNTAR